MRALFYKFWIKNLDNYEYSELLKSLENKILNIANIIKPDSLNARLNEIATLESDMAFLE